MKPKPSELKLIIEAAGGKVLDRAPAGGKAAGEGGAGAQAVVVSTENEKKTWAPLLKKGLVGVRPEVLLTCVMQQEWRVEPGECLG